MIYHNRLLWYIIWPIVNLGFVINQFSQAKASGERLIEILEAESEVNNQDALINTERLNGEVEFKNVSLRYDDNSNEALYGISFKAVPGKVIGLIGSTGSGKQVSHNY